MFREKLKTKLNDSEAGILDVITWIANYKGETLASKLRYNKFSKMQILYMAFDVQENLAKLSKHYMLLLDLSQTYNSFFAAEIKQDRLANITHRFEQLKAAVEITKTTFGNFKEQFSQDLSEEHLVQVSDNSEKEAYVNSLPCRFSIGQGMVVNRKIALTYSQCANMLCEILPTGTRQSDDVPKPHARREKSHGRHQGIGIHLQRMFRKCMGNHTSHH